MFYQRLLLLIYQVKQRLLLIAVDVLPRKPTVRPLLGPRPTTTARQASQPQRALATWAP
jgi:hypothetical protein